MCLNAAYNQVFTLNLVKKIVKYLAIGIVKDESYTFSRKKN